MGTGNTQRRIYRRRNGKKRENMKNAGERGPREGDHAAIYVIYRVYINIAVFSQLIFRQ